jgi:TonB family protein
MWAKVTPAFWGYRFRWIQNICLVQMVIYAQGVPQNLNVVRGLGHGLDGEAIKAAQQYRFKPAYKRGVGLVPVMIKVEVNFKLYN